MRSTALVPLVLAITAAFGCATGNTAAQELSWERWKTCDRFATISLDRIDPDGRLVVKGQEMEATSFRVCVRDAAADQVRRGAIANPEVPVLVKLYGCVGGAM